VLPVVNTRTVFNANWDIVEVVKEIADATGSLLHSPAPRH
jgi:hypothetical protein